MIYFSELANPVNLVNFAERNRVLSHYSKDGQILTAVVIVGIASVGVFVGSQYMLSREFPLNVYNIVTGIGILFVSLTIGLLPRFEKKYTILCTLNIKSLLILIVVVLFSLCITFFTESTKTSFFHTLFRVSPAAAYLYILILTTGVLAIMQYAFFVMLRIASTVDCEAIIFRDELNSKLEVYWYSSKRRSDKYCLVLIRCCSGRKKSRWVLRNILKKKYIRTVLETVARNIRKSDDFGFFARDTVWVILSHTDVIGTEMSVRRIIDMVSAHPAFRSAPPSYSLQVKAGLSEYTIELEQSCDMVLNAQHALEEAITGTDALIVYQSS